MPPRLHLSKKVVHSQGRKKRKEEAVYFFWPVAPLRVSETAWPALLRPCWALSRTLPPSFWALSPPERVESPSFWVVDFWPSVRWLVVPRQKGRWSRTRLDSRRGLVTESGDALAGLVEGRLLGVGSGWWWG
jgi:hypothetical protein